jgi:hypothetical protein
MRQRRFERCLARAGAALAADVLDAAREALDEAQQLSPNDSRVPDLISRLELAETPPPVVLVEPPDAVTEQPGHSGRWIWVASLIVMSAVAGWFAAGGRITIRQLTSIAAQVSVPRVVIPPPIELTAPSSSPTSVAAEPPRASSSTSAASEPSRENEPAPGVAVDSSLIRPSAEKPAAPLAETPRGTVGPERLKPTVPDARANAAKPLSSLPVEKLPVPTDPVTSSKPAPLTAPVGSPIAVSPVTADASVQPAPSLPDLPPGTSATPPPVPALALSSARSTTNAPVASASAAKTTVTDERLVRAALSVYAAAYNQLDASAVRAVWPSVDQRALARAFDGLISQNITLGQCDVRVNGVSAHAECAGSAKWTPKVGGGTQSASRRWRFDFRNTGVDWIIVQVTVR